MQAAGDAGIGMTLLPVLYQYAGFGSQPASPEQARFIGTPESLLTLREHLLRALPESPMRRYGLAPHSLRAVAPEGLAEMVSGLRQQQGGQDAPIHIHIAEQWREMEDCLAWCGQRPVQLLLSLQEVDARWCLVHATHMDLGEYQAVAASGAVVGLCPTTEANLGDGIIDAAQLLQSATPWGIGSDSNIAINLRSSCACWNMASACIIAAATCWPRKRLRPRPTACSRKPSRGCRCQRARRCRTGGGPARRLRGTRRPGRQPGGPQPGAVALGAGICEHDGQPIQDVYVGGRQVVSAGRHRLEDSARQAYRHAIADLLKD
jgi:formimidoylglutamate deiminase